MQVPLREIKSRDHTVWLTQPHEMKTILRRRENAFEIAQGKLAESGNVELVLQTAEAFGRGLFSDFIKKKPKDWTMRSWLESTTQQVFNPLGDGATITKITDEEATSLVFRNLLLEESTDPQAASLFTYGVLRGMLRSAFPKGEVLMGSTMAEGAPMTEFIFKANATADDRTERERVKYTFMTTKK